MAREPQERLSDRLIKSIKPAPEGTRKQVMNARVPGFGVQVTDKASRPTSSRPGSPARPIRPGAKSMRRRWRRPATPRTNGRF